MKRVRSTRLAKTVVPCLTGTLLSIAPASAQAPAMTNGRAQDQAVDAFGVRTGAEQIGLYSESQVRGFSLQDAGNYRLHGAYFVRAGSLVDPILSRVNTRVGVNALGLDFPSPSGVVDYRLRPPSEAPRVSLDLTAREYGGILAEAAVATPVDENVSMLLGGAVYRGLSSAGLLGRSWRAGMVGEWRPNGDATVLGFASINRFDFQGTYGVSVTGEKLPPGMPHPMRYTPSWGDHDGRDLNAGAIATLKPNADVELTASAIYSRLELPEADFVNLAIGPDGLGSATVIVNRPRSAQSLAGAVAGSWRYGQGGRLFGEIRLRDTQNRFRPALGLRISEIDLRAPLPDLPEPVLGSSSPSRDSARQATFAVGHEIDFSKFRLKTGLQKTVYRRRFTPVGGSADSLRSTPWLYDLSLVADLGDGFSGWASVTRGLEEAGVAPGNAVNRNEVLPAILVHQTEVGVRYRRADGLAVIGSAFSIGKPAAVLDRYQRFGLSGSLRHRGLELSVAGPLAPGLRVLAGTLLLDARRGGDLVRTGAISAEPAGISDVQGLLGVTWQIPKLSGLSFDSQLNHWSSRRVRSDRDLRAPAVTTVDIGALYTFPVGENALTLRLRVANLFDSDAWIAQRSELIDRVNRRGVRLTASLRTK